MSDPDVREQDNRRLVWTESPWESAEPLVCLSVLSGWKERKKIKIKGQLNAPLIRLWMGAPRCSSSFMLCRFHRGINATLSQHPSSTSPTPLHCKLCGLPRFFSPNPFGPADVRLSGDVTYTPWRPYWRRPTTCDGRQWELIEIQGDHRVL